VELSETVPDGMIVFMPSYSRMEEWARVWEKDKYLEQVSRNKLLFIESKDVAETSLVIITLHPLENPTLQAGL
jgi:DNA excision repair protein ERCC-2